MSLKWPNPDLIRFEVAVERQRLQNVAQEIKTETTTYLFPWWLPKSVHLSVADERLPKSVHLSVADERLPKSVHLSVADEQLPKSVHLSVADEQPGK